MNELREEEVKKMKVSELRTALSKLGQPTTGLKADLVACLLKVTKEKVHCKTATIAKITTSESSNEQTKHVCQEASNEQTTHHDQEASKEPIKHVGQDSMDTHQTTDQKKIITNHQSADQVRNVTNGQTVNPDRNEVAMETEIQDDLERNIAKGVTMETEGKIAEDVTMGTNNFVECEEKVIEDASIAKEGKVSIEGNVEIPNQKEVVLDVSGETVTKALTHEKKTVNEYELKNLQRELKYEIFETWRQLNLIETYTDDKGAQCKEYYVDVAEARNVMCDTKVVKKRASQPTICCTFCRNHFNEFVFHEHLFTKHQVMKRESWHGVAVLENEMSTRFCRLPSQFANKCFDVKRPYYKLFCMLCKGLEPIAGLEHFNDKSHRDWVKTYVQINNELPDKYVKIGNSTKGSTPASRAALSAQKTHLLYNPHEFMSDCCCRVVDCQYCVTSPFIFDNFMISDNLLCVLCNSSFRYSGFESAANHLRSATHQFKHIEKVKKTGVISRNDNYLKVLKGLLNFHS